MLDETLQGAAECLPMHEFFLKLPHASDIQDSSGKRFVVDVFAGEKTITVAAVLTEHPVVVPWDIQHGERYNVLTRGSELMSLARQGRVSWAHAATPCQSNTWGRSPQLRTEEHLYDGCPGIGKRQSDMVQAGTALVLWTCEFLTEVHASGGYASLENPVHSWI